jgi:UDP-N-acetylglucosamine 4,6-dehydratase/5-epimerase
MENKRILIVGGTGSLGTMLIKKYQTTNKILVYSRNEHKQVTLASETWLNRESVSFMIGDIKDRDSIWDAIETYKPDVIINTAALKHVTVCQTDPYESVKVNIIGHQNLIEVLKRCKHNVETLIFISTDKACKPINVYGMCKAISENLYVDFAKRQNNIKVCLVRYGNVLNSNGSVIPLFKKLLLEGCKFLPITDTRMTRFLLPLEEAINLIDWTYNNPTSHGKIAIPKIKSFKITDIAKAMIKSVYGDENLIPLKVVGIRPGEKLHEEMVSEEEWMKTEEQENYLITTEHLNDEINNYNSYDSLMDSVDVYDFLKLNNIIESNKVNV